jgi:hypothetical protein
VYKVERRLQPSIFKHDFIFEENNRLHYFLMIFSFRFIQFSTYYRIIEWTLSFLYRQSHVFMTRQLGCCTSSIRQHTHIAPRKDLTPAGEFPGLAVVVLPKTVIPVREFPGLDVVVLPKLNFDFFSAGFNIWKEHISVSSTLIMAPALSNSPQ